MMVRFKEKEKWGAKDPNNFLFKSHSTHLLLFDLPVHSNRSNQSIWRKSFSIQTYNCHILILQIFLTCSSCFVWIPKVPIKYLFVPDPASKTCYFFRKCPLVWIVPEQIFVNKFKCFNVDIPLFLNYQLAS